MIRFAFAGFDHGHILEVLRLVQAGDELAVVAAAEEDPVLRAKLESDGTIDVTHHDAEQMIREADCDVVALGAPYAERGALAILALEQGRHVISDKPLCTRLSEWERIAHLAASHRLAVGCQLSMRASPGLCRMREIIADGAVGQVQTVSFHGQHPLNWGHRPGWYFQAGRHGGTINDIAIHGLDAIEWMTGRRFVEVVAARTWNARTPAAPFFQTGAQLMMRLDNQGGVMGDVSYLAPTKCGGKLPTYWRFTVHGDRGMIERNGGSDTLTVACDEDPAPREESIPAPKVSGYFKNFIACVRGETPPDGLDTQAVLRAQQLALLAQQAADTARTRLKVPG